MKTKRITYTWTIEVRDVDYKRKPYVYHDKEGNPYTLAPLVAKGEHGTLSFPWRGNYLIKKHWKIPWRLPETSNTEEYEKLISPVDKLEFLYNSGLLEFDRCGVWLKIYQ